MTYLLVSEGTEFWPTFNVCKTLLKDIRPVFVDARPKFDEHDVLIIPDSGGLNLCAAGFSYLQSMPPEFPPQTQQIEWFRVYTMDYYRKKGGTILAFGASASLVWEALGGKFVLEEPFKALPKRTSGLAADFGETDTHEWYYMTNGAMGMESCSLAFLPKIKFYLEKTKNNGSIGVGVLEQSIPPPTVLRAEAVY